LNERQAYQLVIYLATAGAKHTSFDSFHLLKPKTSKGTKDNQERNIKAPKGGEKEIKRTLENGETDLSEGRSK